MRIGPCNKGFFYPHLLIVVQNIFWKRKMGQLILISISVRTINIDLIIGFFVLLLLISTLCLVLLISLHSKKKKKRVHFVYFSNYALLHRLKLLANNENNEINVGSIM